MRNTGLSLWLATICIGAKPFSGRVKAITLDWFRVTK